LKGVDNMATISIRMDDNLKKDVENVCEELGLSMSTAFTIFAKKLSREKRIPFDVSIDPFYSDMNMTCLRESIEQMEKGNVIVKTMEELEAMADE
jgi:DNA-damage-inducible protein J